MQTDPSAKLDALRGMTALNGATRDDLVPLVAAGEFLEFADGDTLFREGDPGHTLYFVLEGSVRVHRPMPGGGRMEVAELGRGDIVGEVGLLNRRQRRAAASAVGPVRAFRVSRDALLADYRAGKGYALDLVLGIAHTVAQRLDATNLVVCDTARLLPSKDSELETFKRKILEDWAV